MRKAIGAIGLAELRSHLITSSVSLRPPCTDPLAHKKKATFTHSLGDFNTPLCTLPCFQPLAAHCIGFLVNTHTWVPSGSHWHPTYNTGYPLLALCTHTGCFWCRLSGKKSALVGTNRSKKHTWKPTSTWLEAVSRAEDLQVAETFKWVP